MAQKTNADDRSTELKTEMARHFTELEAEYRGDGPGDTNGEVVYEDGQVIVYVDYTGHEINEWASDFSLDRSELVQTFEALAKQVMDAERVHKITSHSDVLVFDKVE
jgi:hypothetical protein